MTAHMKPRTGDRAWLNGAARTWRWNPGTYADRGAYDAVEANPEGLVWYHWEHGYSEGGQQLRAPQTFAAFEQSGPLRQLPPALHDELRAWLKERGHV